MISITPLMSDVRAAADQRQKPVVCRLNGQVLDFDDYIPPPRQGGWVPKDILFVAYPFTWRYKRGRHG